MACSTPLPTPPLGYYLVNYSVHEFFIFTLQTSRGADVSKYINFIHPPPFSLKLLSSSTEEKKSREKTQKRVSHVKMLTLYFLGLLILVLALVEALRCVLGQDTLLSRPLIVPIFTQVYKWVPANLMLKVTL